MSKFSYFLIILLLFLMMLVYFPEAFRTLMVWASETFNFLQDLVDFTINKIKDWFPHHDHPLVPETAWVLSCLISKKKYII